VLVLLLVVIKTLNLAIIFGDSLNIYMKK